MAHLAHREIRPRESSADVLAVVEAAGLKRAWARARYAVRLSGADVGELSSTVTGGQADEQLSYIVEGRLERPMALSLRGFVVAGWDRRVERMVLEASLGAARHRLECRTVREGEDAGLFRVSYLPPGALPEAAREWVLAEAPVLAPGPLPLPEVDGGAFEGSRSGQVVDPVTGEPRDWRVARTDVSRREVAGRVREARRHDLFFGDLEARLWTEPSGFPLELELPGALSLVLVEEVRR